MLIDCDVLQADGGTRTRSDHGRLGGARDRRGEARCGGHLQGNPVTGAVAAVSAGIIRGVPCVDLCYEEDPPPRST